MGVLTTLQPPSITMFMIIIRIWKLTQNCTVCCYRMIKHFFSLFSQFQLPSQFRKGHEFHIFNTVVGRGWSLILIMSNSACNTPFAQCSNTLYKMQWRILHSQRDVLLFRSPGSGLFPFICAVSPEPSSFLYEGSLCTLFLLISAFVKQLKFLV